MLTSLAFVVLGIALAVVGFVTPFEQGLNHLFYPIIGLLLVVHGLSRNDRA
jgi:hypothetical protein